MGRLTVTISSDGLTAELRAGPGPALQPIEAHQALAAAGVIHGIEEAALRDFAAQLDRPQFTGRRLIATGTPPTPGTNGCLVGAFLLPLQPGTELRDGRMDYRERELLHPVHKGDVLATVEPPTAGSDGRDVRGHSLPTKPGRQFAERLGNGVRREGDQILAAQDGVILHHDNLIDVVPLHQHRGNVDLASGNLHSHGSLQVQGDIQPGAAAIAAGDVQIHGAVLDGRVRAGGSIMVSQGIQGAAAQVQAGAALHCHHATSAKLQAGGILEVGDQATHCIITAGCIRITAGRGAVLGGELQAEQSIEVRTTGNEHATPTVLAVATLPGEYAALAKLQAESARNDRLALRRLREGSRHNGKGLRSVDEYEQARIRLRSRQRELLRNAWIRVHGTAHAGTTIRLGNRQQTLESALRHCEFRFDPEQDSIRQLRLP